MALFGNLIKKIKSFISPRPKARPRRRKSKHKSKRRIIKTGNRKTKKRLPIQRRARPRKSARKKTLARKAKVRHEIKVTKAAQPKQAFPAAKKSATTQPQPEGFLVAEITHYFSKISVCVLRMQGSLSVGDMIRIKGKNTDFIQRIESMQIESINVNRVKKGQLIGLKVHQICKVGDKICKLRK